MKKFLKYILIIYITLWAVAFFGNYLKLPKEINEISNTTKGLPNIKIIEIERYLNYGDNSFFVLGDNNHIYKIDPDKREVIKDIEIKGLSNPNGFCVVSSYSNKKKMDEIYIADTGNMRIIKVESVNNNSTEVDVEEILTVKSGKPMDVRYFDYSNKGYTKKIYSIAVLIDDNKIDSFNLETKQLQKSVKVYLHVNDSIVGLKNIPYYKRETISNWGMNTEELKSDNYLESIEDQKVISKAHLSTDIGKISYFDYYVIPDNGNRLIWINSSMAHTDNHGEAVRETLGYRTIRYEKEIDSVIRYGDNNQEKLLVIAYKNLHGITYANVDDSLLAKVFNIGSTMVGVLTMPFIIPFMGKQ